MKKHNLIRAAFCTLLSLFVLFGTAMTAAAARPYEDIISNCKIYDEDDMFDEYDEQAINDMILETSREIDMYVAVVIRDENAPAYSDMQIMTLADDKYDELFNVQYQQATDGALLYLNLSTRYAYISTCGLGQLYYSNSAENDRISTIINGMRSYLQNEDYKGAISYYLSMLKSYQKSGIPARAYTYDASRNEFYYYQNGELVSGKKLPFGYLVNWPLVIGIGLAVGALAALITGLVIRSRYKLVKSLNATNYISNQDTHFYQKDDLFLRTHTSKVRIDSGGSGGGGGGSSHMSSGGFSHGGGGGHW